MTSVRQRLAVLVESLRRQPRVVTAEAVFAAYGSAGGGLLAAGLAYSGLLASLSACLLIVRQAGFLVRDPVRQAALVEELAQRLPPLAELLRTGLDRVAESATEFSILGLLGLSWGSAGSTATSTPRSDRSSPAPTSAASKPASSSASW